MIFDIIMIEIERGWATSMLHSNNEKQNSYEVVCIEQWVSQNHLLWKLQCTRSKKNKKVITRHVWEDSKEWVRENCLTTWGKMLYKKRKETIERSFADAKQLYGFRYCRLRGRDNVQDQALMTATCQNMKKIANHLAKLA